MIFKGPIIQWANLSLSFSYIKRSNSFSFLPWNLYFSKFMFILSNILLQCHKQTLCMFRRKNYTTIYNRLG